MNSWLGSRTNCSRIPARYFSALMRLDSARARPVPSHGTLSTRSSAVLGREGV